GGAPPATRPPPSGADPQMLKRGGGGGANLTRGAFVRLVAAAAGIPPPRAGRLDPVRRWLRRLRGRKDPGVPDDLSCDPSWSVAALGLPQSPLEEAFAEAVAWFRSRGMA
ncbi:MAG: hypothetical protein ACUVYA_12425, partial [Planctomycetota bacterium]